MGHIIGNREYGLIVLLDKDVPFRCCQDRILNPDISAEADFLRVLFGRRSSKGLPSLQPVVRNLSSWYPFSIFCLNMP